MISDNIISGIDIVGNIPWGAHFCQFYQTKEDLMDVLIPYFKAGLENNEFCLWVIPEPLDEEEAKEALKIAIPDINFYLENGQIEIIPYTYWDIKDGILNPRIVLNQALRYFEWVIYNPYLHVDLLYANSEQIDYENQFQARCLSL